MYIYIHTHIHIHVYMYIYLYIGIYVYIYIQMGLFLRFACAFFMYEGYLTYFQGPFDIFLKAI